MPEKPDEKVEKYLKDRAEKAKAEDLIAFENAMRGKAVRPKMDESQAKPNADE